MTIAKSLSWCQFAVLLGVDLREKSIQVRCGPGCSSLTHETILEEIFLKGHAGKSDPEMLQGVMQALIRTYPQIPSAACAGLSLETKP